MADEVQGQHARHQVQLQRVPLLLSSSASSSAMLTVVQPLPPAVHCASDMRRHERTRHQNPVAPAGAGYREGERGGGLCGVLVERQHHVCTNTIVELCCNNAILHYLRSRRQRRGWALAVLMPVCFAVSYHLRVPVCFGIESHRRDWLCCHCAQHVSCHGWSHVSN